MSLVGADVYGKLSWSRPIKIDFEKKPSKRIDQGDVYTLSMSWRNLDLRRSYEGSFIFISKGIGIRADHVTLTFEGSAITPEESVNTLRFTLPRQTFPRGASGVVSVEIMYNKAGIFLWEIGVARFP